MSIVNNDMSAELDPYAKPKSEALIAEDELLKYLLAFETLLEEKQIRYEWSFTDYHLVNAPPESFRSIIEYVLNKATVNHYTPDYILVFSHSYEYEMVIEFEISHAMEQIDEFYFQQSDIDILNQIYSHHGWKLSCETNHVGSLLTWSISRFEAIERDLSPSVRQLKAQHLTLANFQNNSEFNQLAKALYLDIEARPLAQLPIILEKHYQLETLNLYQLAELKPEQYEILVIRGPVNSVVSLLSNDSPFKETTVPIFVVAPELEIESKIKLLELGVMDVVSEPISAINLISTIKSNSKAQYALLQNSKTGAVNRPSSVKSESNAQHLDNQILELVRQHVSENYHDPDFNAHALSQMMNVPLAKIDFLLSKRIVHTTAQYITSCRLAEAYELIEDGNVPEQVALDCGFHNITTFDQAFTNKYGESVIKP